MSVEPSPPVVEQDPVKKITDWLKPELESVDSILRDSLDSSESDLVREVGEYICFTKGKKLRPMLTVLIGKALAPDRPSSTEVAAAIELIHVATLIHDDVIDKASMRRGRASVNAHWGDDVAILMADYLYARAFDLALSSLRPEVLRLLCQVTQRMCEGEMFQIQLREKTLSSTDYFHVVERKTASLFAACTSLGALLAGRGSAEISLASSFGYDFGIAFQITDDVLDFVAHDEQWGKDVGMDVSGGKQTLPLLLAMADATDEEREQLDGWMNNGSRVDPVLDIIQRYNGVDRALAEARVYADRASVALASLNDPEREALEHLAALPAYVVSRIY